jgi:hypothetical protein
MSGFYIAQALVNPDEEIKKEKQAAAARLKNNLEALEKSISDLIELENSYNQLFEKDELLQKKTKGLKLFGNITEPLLPDLGIKAGIAKQELVVEAAHHALLASATKAVLTAMPKALLERYYAISHHFHVEEEDTLALRVTRNGK